MLNLTEIYKLKKLLEVAKVLHNMEDLDGGKKITIYDRDGDMLDDAILTKYSNGRERGLLETYFLNDCDGYETAIEVFSGWARKYWI